MDDLFLVSISNGIILNFGGGLKYKIMLSLFLCISFINAVEFFLKPGVKRINTGIAPFWVFQGGEIGFVYNYKHQISLDAYLYNDVDNAIYYFDSVSFERSWSDDIRHYGNFYVNYSYCWQVKDFFNISTGLSLGIKYAEYDRNFDTTVALTYSIDSMKTISSGDVFLRHEVEGRFMGFGGPRSEFELGYKKFFFRVLLQLNIGRLENWGYFKTRSKGVTNVLFNKTYSVNDIVIAQPGWQGAIGNSLFTKWKIIPEILFGMTIYL